MDDEGDLVDCPAGCLVWAKGSTFEMSRFVLEDHGPSPVGTLAREIVNSMLTFMRGTGLVLARFEGCTIRGDIGAIGPGMDESSVLVFDRCRFVGEAGRDVPTVFTMPANCILIDCEYDGLRPYETGEAPPSPRVPARGR